MTQTEMGEKVRPEALMLVWAFAESGIGGMLHALKLPLTGIFVGGIAVICISLLAWYSGGNRQLIHKALLLVLSVKLAVSPHSPWQAYVAVLFQGYLGYFMFQSVHHFKIKALVFSMVCLLESACQKLLIAFLVFGTNFFKAIDQAAMSLAKSFHVDTDFSLVWTIFAVYLIAHILVGMILGFWIPKLPGQIQKSFVQVPAFEPTAVLNPKAKRSRMTMLVLSLTTVLLLLLFIRVALPSQPVMQLVYIFIRSIIVSMLLVIVVGPAVLFLVKKILKNKSSHNNVGASFVIINHLPEFSSQVYQMFVWVNQSFTGIQKIKHYILGLFVVSTRSTDRFRI